MSGVTRGAPLPRSAHFQRAARELADDHHLPQRWQQRERFVMLDTGFGHGERFLVAWQAWRADSLRSARLVYLAIEPGPLTREAMAASYAAVVAIPGAANEVNEVERAAEPANELIDALLRAWPPLTHNLHRLAFDDGQVELLVGFFSVREGLSELVARVDAFCLADIHGSDAIGSQEVRIAKALARLAAPGATLSVPVARDGTPAPDVADLQSDPAWRRAYSSAGFRWATPLVQQPPSPVSPTVRAVFDPPFTPRHAPSRGQADRGEPGDRAYPASPPHALVIGAGLAGCATAWALAEQGWHSTLLERHATPAAEASGNPAGLFHGIVNAHDGLHARFNRAASLAARHAVQMALDRGVPGAANGLLRLETTLDATRMRGLLARQGLPADYVGVLDAEAASACAGIRLAWPCWHYPGGGWVQPVGLARSFLERAGSLAQWQGGHQVATLRHSENGWAALDASGGVIAQAPKVIVANAGDALRLLGAPAWPIDSVRGQISLVAASRLALPRLPIAGAGYLLPRLSGASSADPTPAVDELAMFGATAQRGDTDPAVRASDHALNLAQLERLTGRVGIGIDLGELAGHTAWRCSAVDRLPLIGAVPASAVLGARSDQPRFVPRVPGLFVFAGLGSRGITWSALGAQVLASWITGAPAPIEASLLDAIDPARFVSRRARRAAAGSDLQAGAAASPSRREA